MSTRSTIGYYEEETGYTHTVYCQNDGMFSFNGKTLNEHYNSLNSAKELISCGPIETLESTIEKTNFKSNPKYCWGNTMTIVTYDKHGKYVDLLNEKNKQKVLIEDHIYIFKDNKWFYFNLDFDNEEQNFDNFILKGINPINQDPKRLD